MNHAPAGGGLDKRPEYITDESIDDSRIVNNGGQWEALIATRETLLDVINRVHNTYHMEGDSRPPGAALTWEHCHRTVCRQVKARIDELDGGGYR